MWKHKEHQGLRAPSHQVLESDLQGSSSFRPPYFLVYRQAALQLGGQFTCPHSYCLKFSAGSHKGHLGTLAHPPLGEPYLDSFKCTAIVPLTDQGCWELEEWELERLGNGEGQRWDNRWRSESPLEASPHNPLVTYPAHAWKRFLAESYMGRSKIQDSLALNTARRRGRGWLTDHLWIFWWVGGICLFSRLRDVWYGSEYIP